LSIVLPLPHLPFFFSSSPPHLPLHSFPTRRSSDLSRDSDSLARPGFLSQRRQRLFQAASACAHGNAHRGNRQSLRSGRADRKDRSEEHTSELQSRGHLVCRLLLEKKKKTPHRDVIC